MYKYVPGIGNRKNAISDGFNCKTAKSFNRKRGGGYIQTAVDACICVYQYKRESIGIARRISGEEAAAASKVM